jgi:hypothetical protein
VLAAAVTAWALGACSSGGGADASNASDAAIGQDAADATGDGPADASDGDNWDGGIRVPDGPGYPTLADYGFFAGNGASQQPVAGVIPYEVNATLYADFAHKRRFLYVPPGQHIGFVAADRWVMPVGAVLIKTFSYLVDERDPSRGERLIETRLLPRMAPGCRAVRYQGNPALTGARGLGGVCASFNW